MDVLIAIKGVQSLDGDSDTIELTTVGIMEPTQDGYLLQYQETPITGMPGTVTTLRIAPSQVQLERSGSLSSLLVLEKGRRHQTSYETPYGSLLAGTYTEELDIDLTEEGGRLVLTYTMDMNGAVTGRHTVHIDVKRM